MYYTCVRGYVCAGGDIYIVWLKNWTTLAALMMRSFALIDAIRAAGACISVYGSTDNRHFICVYIMCIYTYICGYGFFTAIREARARGRRDGELARCFFPCRVV